jgi:siroheme synthase
VSRAVTIVTGHEAVDSESVDWRAVARIGSTVVVLMGIERRSAIAERLVEGGLATDTPCAVVMHATTPQQRVWAGRLDQLADADVESPAVMVIGAVAAMANEAAALVAERTLPDHG